MSKINFNILGVSVAMIVVALGFMAGNAGSVRKHSTSDVRKADYLFLEAQKYRALDDEASYYELIEAAYNLNPADKYLAKEYGVRLVMTAGSDSMQFERGVKMMRDYIDLNPSDTRTGSAYASLMSMTGHDDESVRVWEMLYENASDISVVGAAYASVLSYTGKKENISKAIDVIERIEDAEGGTNINTTMRKMQYYMMLADTAAVLREVKSLLATSPSSVEYNALMGNVYMELGMPDSALVLFDRAVQLDPTSGLAYYSRANYYKSTADTVAYDREMYQVLRLPDLEYETKFALLHDYVANYVADTTQRGRITDMFQMLIDQYPHESGVRLLFGDYLTEISDYPAAAEQISYALDASPDDERRWAMLGALYFSSHEYDKVLRTAKNAIYYFPDAVNFYELASAACSQLKDYDGAFSYLGQAAEKADSADISQMSSIVGAIGDVYYAKGLLDSAFVYYDKALAIDPDNLMAMNNCAYHLACNGRDLDRALDLIEKVVAAKPEDATSLDTYAWVLFKRKDYAKAREVIDSVLELDDLDESSSSDVLEHAGDIYFMDGAPDEALDFWKQALKLSPDNELLQRKVKFKTFFFK